MVAPGRFELPSQDPESRMIDRYTTGLRFPPRNFPFLTLCLWQPTQVGRPLEEEKVGIYFDLIALSVRS